MSSTSKIWVEGKIRVNSFKMGRVFSVQFFVIVVPAAVVWSFSYKFASDKNEREMK